MEIMDIDPSFTAIIRPEEGANVGLIRTCEGVVLIDTASSPAEIQAILNAARVQLDEVQLVINTHFHSDHTWGNQLFKCSILGQRLCRERMQANLNSEWSPVAFQELMNNLEKTEPQKAAELRRAGQGLEIKLPDQVFEGRFAGDLGDIKYEIIHLGGHTPDLSIVWLPGKGVLYASDLIFQGRYPYVFDADIPAWIEALKRLLAFGAMVIIPGHGVQCREADILLLSDYLEQTWRLTEAHIQKGHSLEETWADSAFPIYAAGKREKLHPANIRYMYERISARSASNYSSRQVS